MLSSSLYADTSQAAETFDTLRIHGSNTIGEKFAPELIKGFLRKEGYQLLNNGLSGSKIEREILVKNTLNSEPFQIDLHAHGSSTGFKGLLSLEADIAMSSRQIKAKEVRDLSRLYPSIASGEAEHIIAYDALAIIVNTKNPVMNLSIEDLAKIFSGEITNWREIGGLDLPIKTFSRDNNSGTYDTFNNLVLKPFDKKLATNSVRIESSQELAESVDEYPEAIGFIGISHVAKDKILAISKTASGTSILPQKHTIGTEDYPLSRKLYLYLPTEIENPLAHRFVRFVKSNTGQSLAKKSQLISFFPTKSKPQFRGLTLQRQFKNLRTLGQRLSVAFKLDENKQDAKWRRDVQRMVSYSKQNPFQKIVLTGFYGSEQSTTEEKQALKIRMQELEIQLQNEEIDPWHVHAGYVPTDWPSGLDDSEATGRIEVWVL